MTMDFQPQRWSHLPEHNEKLLTRTNLLDILGDFSTRILQLFKRPVRLVVHGGAVMLLHPGLYAQPGSRRRATRDVDYIHRSFVDEWRLAGVHDAEARLQSCINATAHQFQLGADWMNAHADVALPMAHDAQGRPYDPIYTSSLKPNNVHLHTVYNSAGLHLVSVTPFWAVALKMVRYQKDDPNDITAILRNGTRLNGVQWCPDVLEKWLLTECWAMGYASYPTWLIHDMREKIGHAVRQLNAPPEPDQPLSRQSSADLVSRQSMDMGSSQLSNPPPHRSRTPPPAHPVIPPGTDHRHHMAMPVRHHQSLELLHPTQRHHARSISRHQSLPYFDPSMPQPQPQPFPHASAPQQHPPMPVPTQPQPFQHLSMPPTQPQPFPHLSAPPQHPPMPPAQPQAFQHAPAPPQHPPMPVPALPQPPSIPGPPLPRPHHAAQMARPPSMPLALLLPPHRRSPTPHHASSQRMSPPQQHHPPAPAAPHPMAMPVIPTAQLRGMAMAAPPPLHPGSRRSTPVGFAPPPQHGDVFQHHGGVLNWTPRTSIMVGH